MAPRAMNNTMAVTLIIANQYSNVPKLLTERAFTYSRMTAKASDHIHTGVPGNQ
jgi:ABC-type phosphate transport system permease subunit